jgi:uncharacterized membrane protein
LKPVVTGLLPETIGFDEAYLPVLKWLPLLGVSVNQKHTEVVKPAMYISARKRVVSSSIIVVIITNSSLSPVS